MSKKKIEIYHANLLKRYVEREKHSEDNNKNKLDVLAETGLIESVCVGVIDSGFDETADGEHDIGAVHDNEKIKLPNIQGKETFKDVLISDELDIEQQEQVRLLVEEFQDVLTDMPGEINLVEHELNLTSSDPIRTKQYPLPHALQKKVREEAETML